MAADRLPAALIAAHSNLSCALTAVSADLERLGAERDAQRERAEKAEFERNHLRALAIHLFVEDTMSVYEDYDSVRSPDWYEATCSYPGCLNWAATGRESGVRDAASEHAAWHIDARLTEARAAAGEVRTDG